MSGGRGGKARGRPTGVEGAAAHRVGPSGSRLMACLARGASATVVSQLHFETVRPTVPCPVPGWFHGRPMGWAGWGGVSGRLAGGRGEGRRARSRRVGGHHRGECALYVLDCLGERGVGCDEVVDGGVLLDGRVGKVVERCGHLLCLFNLGGLVGTEGRVAGRHAGDVSHFSKRRSPVEFPISPRVIIGGAALPFSPVECHVAAGERVLGPGGYHQFVGNWDSCVGGEDLALLLFARVDGQWEAGVDADVELGHVVVQVGLADLGVRGQDVLNQRAEVNAVESFCRIIEDGVVDVVDGGGELVSSDGEDKAVGSPCFPRGNVDGTQFLTLLDVGTVRNDGVCWRFRCWDCERRSVSSQVDGRILK